MNIHIHVHTIARDDVKPATQAITSPNWYVVGYRPETQGCIAPEGEGL